MAIRHQLMGEEDTVIQKIRQLFTNLKDNRGFTLMELCVVVAIVGVLASIAIKSYMDSRMHMVDAAALAEARGLGKSVINIFLDGGDVDLFHNPADGPQIGAVDTSGNGRKPIFVLTSGIQADITGNSDWAGTGKGQCVAWVSHPLGSKSYLLVIDEVGGTTSFPTF